MVTRAVSTWSLHRTLGRFVAEGSAVGGGRFFDSTVSPDGLSLLELPAELRKRGYAALQICHFHLPSRSADYLEQLRAALTESGIELESLLIDDGDLTGPHAARDEAWIAGWLETGIALGTRRARVSAGRSAPSAETILASAAGLRRLAESHPEIRVMTENWQEMTSDGAAVNTILDEAGPSVGLLIDLGNWRGPEKYRELGAIAARAESCHAKCHFGGGVPDREDFVASLRVLQESGFDGAMALIYDGSDEDEWAGLEIEYEMVREVFG